MSRQAAADYLRRVRADSETRAKLGPNPTPESYREDARRAGLEFSLDELRGVVNAEKFYYKAQDDPALFKRLSTAGDEAAVVALAREEGFECQLEDLQAVLDPVSGELSDTELESVAGGRKRFSFPEVSKIPAPPSPFVPIPYPTIPYPN